MTGGVGTPLALRSGMTDSHPVVTHNPDASRFEIDDPAGLAVLEYLREGDRVVMTHTEVPVAVEGRGYGSALAEAALAWVRESGLRVVPACPFVNAFVRRNRDYQDLVAA